MGILAKQSVEEDSARLGPLGGRTATERANLAAQELLDLATRGLSAAAANPHPYDRYAAAQLAALRAAAAIVAQRSPASGRQRVTSVWQLLAGKAPELGEWAAFFEAGSGRRKMSDVSGVWVTSREADDMLRDSVTFVHLVAGSLGRRDERISKLGDRLVST